VKCAYIPRKGEAWIERISRILIKNTGIFVNRKKKN
jgi:hypothetical protein